MAAVPQLMSRQTVGRGRKRRVMGPAVGWLLLQLAAGLAVVAASFGLSTAMMHCWWPPRPPNPYLIRVTSATYAGNCLNFVTPAGHHNTVKLGNLSDAASQACNNNDVVCPVLADRLRLGEPSYGCAGDLLVTWRCGSDETLRRQYVPPEAISQIAWLTCRTQQ